MKTKIYMALMASAVAGMVQAGVIDIEKDTFVVGGINAGRNYGANLTTRVRNQAADFRAKSYLEVDVGSILNTGETFANTAVKMTAQVGAATTAQIGLRIYGITDNADAWIEGNGGTDNNPAGEITWNNAPKNNTASGSGVLSSGTVLLDTIIVGIGAFTTDSVWSFSSTALDEYLNWTAGAISDPYGNGASSDTAATFIAVAVQIGPNFNFYSSEHATGQQAQVEYTVIPEPATLGMVAVTAAGLLFIRRLRL